MNIRLFVLVASAAAALGAQAARHVGFETDAFNRAFPANYQKSIVFSPAAFEFDCLVFAKALDEARRAKIAETMGVMVDLDVIYRPILDELAVRTNGLSFVTAHGFVVPEIAHSSAEYRRMLQDEYSAAVCMAFPKDGCEAWFRAQMDGEMEDFELPQEVSMSRSSYSYYDLASIRVGWATQFPPAGSHRGEFRLANGSTTNLEYMSSLRKIGLWETRKFTLMRLYMQSDCEFYAMVPNGSHTLDEIRPELSSDAVERLLTVMESVTEDGVSHPFARVSLPKANFDSRLDFGGIMRYYRFPTKGLRSAAGELPAKELVQRVKFSLGEGGGSVTEKDGEELAGVSVADVREIRLDRPFIFFVYHAKTATIPVAGQFTGL